MGEALLLRIPDTAGVHAQEVEFLAAIREGREAESSGLDGARALELVEGAYAVATVVPKLFEPKTRDPAGDELLYKFWVRLVLLAALCRRQPRRAVALRRLEPAGGASAAGGEH